MAGRGYIVRADSIAEAIRPVLGACATTLRPDMVRALERARKQETYEPAGRILDQFIENARIAERDDVALCQDTGTVWVLIEVDPEVSLVGDIQRELDAVTGQVWEDKGLRASLVKDALLDRANTKDNTPVFVEIVAWKGSYTKAMPRASRDDALDTSIDSTGALQSLAPPSYSFLSDSGTCPLMLSASPEDADYQDKTPGVRVSVMLKGAGSDNASRVIMLSPAQGVDDIEKELIDLVNEKASMACPPLVIGIGIGSTFDKVAGLSKKALLRNLEEIHPNPAIAELEQRLLSAVNTTGRGPAGLGGNTTALRVLINTAPSHIAALPVAINIGCSALRSRTIFVPAQGDGEGE